MPRPNLHAIIIVGNFFSFNIFISLGVRLKPSTIDCLTTIVYKLIIKCLTFKCYFSPIFGSLVCVGENKLFHIVVEF